VAPFNISTFSRRTSLAGVNDDRLEAFFSGKKLKNSNSKLALKEWKEVIKGQFNSYIQK